MEPVEDPSVNKFVLLKEALAREFLTFFSSLIQPIWVPDKQSKMVSLKNNFHEDIREKRDSAQCDTAPSESDSAQCDTAPSRTLRSMTLRGVNS